MLCGSDFIFLSAPFAKISLNFLRLAIPHICPKASYTVAQDGGWRLL